MPRTSICTRSCAGERGFTLTELIVVIGIITVLSAIAFPALTDFRRKSELREAARSVEGDLGQIRMAARAQQLSNLYVTFDASGYVAFIDRNGSKSYDAGDESIFHRTLRNGVAIDITSTTVGAVAPFSRIKFTALGTLSDPSNRVITVSMPSEPLRRYQITLWSTGSTNVVRSEDGGATYPTKGW